MRDEPKNEILSRLPPADYLRLAPDLEPVPLVFKERLYEAGERIRYVYFVTSGVVSIVTSLDTGLEIIETGTIGREGVVGIAVFLGMMTPTDIAICQVPGSGVRIETKRFLAATEKLAALRLLLLRYAYGILAMTSQTAACNRAHNVDARMPRWLLMTRDRVDSDTFPLTQEFLGQMLGVHRPAVSIAGTALQEAGLIEYSRGRITIVDRKGLEARSCECYVRIRRDLERVFDDIGR